MRRYAGLNGPISLHTPNGYVEISYGDPLPASVSEDTVNHDEWPEGPLPAIVSPPPPPAGLTDSTDEE